MKLIGTTLALTLTLALGCGAGASETGPHDETPASASEPRNVATGTPSNEAAYPGLEFRQRFMYN